MNNNARRFERTGRFKRWKLKAGTKRWQLIKITVCFSALAIGALCTYLMMLSLGMMKPENQAEPNQSLVRTEKSKQSSAKGKASISSVLPEKTLPSSSTSVSSSTPVTTTTAPPVSTAGSIIPAPKAVETTVESPSQEEKGKEAQALAQSTAQSVAQSVAEDYKRQGYEVEVNIINEETGGQE